MWQALGHIPNDYTVTTFLLKDGVLVGQHDSYPLNGLNPTTLWDAGAWYYDSHAISIENLPAGEYQLGIGVYTWWDVKNLPITPCFVDVCNTVIVDTVTIK